MSGAKVFISYSSHDGELAEAFCTELEAAGVPCWIAPRDVEAGAYGSSIVRGIRGAKALLFIASAHSAASGHVRRELERAVDAGVPIVPIRIDGTAFSDELEYYLAGMHWIELAGETPASATPKLAERLLGIGQEDKATASASARAPAPISQRRGIAERVLDALLLPPPPLVGLVLATIGAAFVLFSALFGFGEFEYRLTHNGAVIEKEVGFVWAINWSLSLIIVYPAIAGIGLQALREMAALPERLIKRRMIVDGDFRTARIGYAKTEFRKALRVGTGAAIILLPIFVIYSVWEFQTIVGTHFDSGVPFPELIPLDHPMQERDWSVAALLPTAASSPPLRSANYGFALVAYVWLVGFGSALVLSIFISFLAGAGAVYRLSARNEGLRIVPDLRNPQGRRAFDNRCGFEVFERLFRHSMVVVLLCFVALFLVNLQNTYIRQPDAHILDYLLPDFSFPNGFLEEFVGGQGGRSTLTNLNGALSTAVGGMLFAIIVFGLAITLRIGARQAHALMLERIEDTEEPLPVFLEETSRDDALERLDDMRFWPVRWLGLNRILAAITLAAISLIFHKVGLFVVVIALIYIFSVSFADSGSRR